MDYKFKILGAFFLAFGFIIFVSVLAQEKPNIQFPVKELGNCKSEADCKKFCDQKENVLICLEFAEKQGLMSKNEVARAKKLLNIKNEGLPGGCASRDDCQAYCAIPEHMEGCLEFAQRAEIISKEELEEAR